MHVLKMYDSFSIDIDRADGIYIYGRGHGHGVGMCQWGAMGMARQRYTYDDILTYYYPGTELKSLSAVKDLLN